jgi:anti-anti-sigma factor
MPGFQMSIDADLREVEALNAAVGDFADAQGLPTALRRSLHVVLDELLTNTVLYGLVGREGGWADVALAIDGDRLVLTLRDNGSPFDPFALPAPDTTLSVDERPIGGLGIHLVRQLMDEVGYTRDGDTNVVTLGKRLERRQAAGDRGGRAMEITTRTTGDTTIIAVVGKLDSITSPQAQQAIDAVLAGGATRVALDFGGLDYISSAGLRVMLSAAKKLGASGGRLRMFGLNHSVREVFDISGFSAILPVFPTEGDAVSAP